MGVQARFSFEARGNFLNGAFAKPSDPNGQWTSRSPADLSDEIGVFTSSYHAVDDVIASARGVASVWRKRSPTDRADYLRRYQAAIKRRQDEIAELIAREVGKPLWEAKSEVASMLNKVDITLEESMKLVTDYEISRIMENTRGTCRYRPHGVMAVIGPFNFPGHLPNGHIVPALATGNTVVFKPSEKAPMVGQLMAECFQEAGLPPGVFNLIQGEKEVGRRLCVHEDVDGVLFTGSYEIGTRIKQDTLQQHWKILALEMGGKNSAIVWEDADLEAAVHETLVGAFVTAGQRCSATSRVLVHSRVADAFIRRLHDRSKAFSIGHPLSNPFMGPLIDSSSVDRYMKFLGIASREGCEILMRGKALELETRGHYVTPSICLITDPTLAAAKKSIYQQTELFAPNVAITAVHAIEEAVQLANATQYGLVASVFTRSKAVYEVCVEGLQCGLVNLNKSTVGASSRLPFGGVKKSGNHFPTALPATLYCSYPVASLEVDDPQPVNPASFPGLNWA